MSGRQAFDALGVLIEGQQGNRTPVVTYVYPRRQLRQGQFVNADATGAPVIPVTLRYSRPANSWRPAQHSANNIQRYYQAFDVSDPLSGAAPFQQYVRGLYVQPPSLAPNRIGRYYQDLDLLFPQVAAPIADRPRTQPFAVPGPSVTNRIQRYYAPQIIDPLPDAPVDRPRTQAWSLVSPSLAPNRIGRYYVPFPFDPTPPPTPGTDDGTQGRGRLIWPYRQTFPPTPEGVDPFTGLRIRKNDKTQLQIEIELDDELLLFFLD